MKATERKGLEPYQTGYWQFSKRQARVYYVTKMSICRGIKMKVTNTDKSGKNIEQAFNTEDECKS